MEEVLTSADTSSHINWWSRPES